LKCPSIKTLSQKLIKIDVLQSHVILRKKGYGYMSVKAKKNFPQKNYANKIVFECQNQPESEKPKTDNKEPTIGFGLGLGFPQGFSRHAALCPFTVMIAFNTHLPVWRLRDRFIPPPAYRHAPAYRHPPASMSICQVPGIQAVNLCLTDLPANSTSV
jgi:hypothetical protein